MQVNQSWEVGVLGSGLTWLMIPFSVTLWAMAPAAIAQIIPDDTLGAESSRVRGDVEVRGGRGERIEGGAIRAGNLFHSFSEFNVNELQRVYFSNPAGIENILSRVTGDDVSDILGTLGVDGDANLFLLNPNGIVFGPNSRLDVAGSFVATTADAFEFAEGSSFSALDPNAPPLLTVVLTPGLQYGANAGAIQNQGNLTVGEDLTLAAGTLNLQGQLQAGGDLTLYAQDTLTIRDSVTAPFIASSWQNLLVQGNQGVDIFALNHPDSGLFAGNDLTLRSATPVIGDAHYWSGGNFRIEQLDESLGALTSPNDPVIRATGDVAFDSYTGASLHIFAGGSVTVPGAITIMGADPVNGIVEEVTLSDGSTFSINGQTTPTLDIRAGTLAVNPTGAIGDTAGFVPGVPATGAGATSSDIDIGSIRNASGTVFLTNQYQPNLALAGGDIQVRGAIDVSFESNGVDADDGGEVLIQSNTGDISISQLWGFSTARGGGNAGNGGTVTLRSASGNIDVNELNFGVYAPDGMTGNGGTVTFESGGNITISNYLIAHAHTDRGTAGNGGAVTLRSNTGNIDVDGSVGVYSVATENGNTGNAGTVLIESDSGTITANLLNGYSTAFGVDRTGGNGGSITVRNTSGNIDISGLNFGVYAPDGTTGNGGIVTVESGGGITIRDYLIAHAHTDRGTAGNGGVVTLRSESGNINIPGSVGVYSVATENGNTGNAGTVLIESDSGTITANLLNGYSTAFGVDRTGGNGGSITVRNTSGNIDINGLNFGVYAPDGTTGNGGIVTVESGGGITIGNYLIAHAHTDRGTAGNGGVVTLRSESGNINIPGSVGVYSVATENGNTGNAGTVLLETNRGDISANELNGYSTVFGSGNAGNGGMIMIRNSAGSINATTLNSSSFTASGNAGNGGFVTLESLGSITLGSIDANSQSNSGNASDGGFIQVESIDGDINISERLFTFSYSQENGNAGNAGYINLSAQNVAGTNANTRLLAFAIVPGGESLNAGRGGNVEINAANSVANLEISTLSSNDESGSVSVLGSDALTIQNTRLTTSAQTTVPGIFGGTIYLTQRVRDSTNDQNPNDGLGSNPAIGVIDDVQPETIEDQSAVTVPTFGPSGSVTIASLGNLSLNNVQILSNANGESDAGDITVDSPALIRLNSSEINSNTESTGNAGTIDISAGLGLILEGDSQILAGTTYSGVLSEGNDSQGGRIELDTPQLQLGRDTEISAITSGSARGGSIFVSSPNSLDIFGSGRITVDTRGSGAAGTIKFSTPTLNLQGPVEISATATETATSRAQSGGNINVNVSNLTFSAPATLSAETEGSAPAGRMTFRPHATGDSITLDFQDSNAVISTSTSADGLGGNLTLRAPTAIVLHGNGQVLAETSGSGDAGDVRIETTNLTLRDEIEVSTTTEGTGSGGNIFINGINDTRADRVTLIDAELSAETDGPAPAGDIRIRTGEFVMRNGAEVTTSTNSAGDGGDILVRAADFMRLGNSTILAESNPIDEDGTVLTTDPGDAGRIQITTPQLLLQNGAQISASNVSSSSEGIQLLGLTQLTLEESSQILASTDTGSAGDIEVDAPGGSVLLRGAGTRLAAETATETDSDLRGSQAGTVSITTSQMSVLNNAEVSISTRNGTGGDLTLTVDELIVSESLILAQTGNGDAGDLTVNTSSNPADSVVLSGVLADGTPAGLSVEATGERGQAGTLLIHTRDLTVRDGADLSAETIEGNINNQGDTIRITDLENLTIENARISASTQRSGFAGGVTIETSESVRLSGSWVDQDGRPVTDDEGNPFVDAEGRPLPAGVFVEGRGEGIARPVRIFTGQLIVEDGAQASVSTENGQGGDLIVRARDSVRISDGAGLFARATGSGEAGSIDIQTPDLLLRDGATVSATNVSTSSDGVVLSQLDRLRVLDSEISTSTRRGEAGDVLVNSRAGSSPVDSMLVSGNNARIAAEATGQGGRAGRVQLNVRELTVQNGGTITAANRSGTSDEVRIVNLDNLNVLSGGSISASTVSGEAGSVIVSASDRVTVSGEGSRLEVEARRDGRAGDLEIQSGELRVTEGGVVSVSSRDGQAGNLLVNSPIIFLDDGELRAETAFTEFGAEGANISLQGLQLLVMQNGSLISASASNRASGGNISINSSTGQGGFIVAPNFNNNDIIATAVQGQGGEINIFVDQLFGFTLQDSPEGLRDNLTNDISASSAGGPQGIVNLDTLDIDPSRGLGELPLALVSAPPLDAVCGAQRDESQSSFVVAGREGLPSSPAEFGATQPIPSAWVSRSDAAPSAIDPVGMPEEPESVIEIVEAQGWIVAADGTVALVSSAALAEPSAPTPTSHPGCS